MHTDAVISFGPPDEASAAQLERCLAVSGDEARGVLCADHHKGYGMPIGGVLASKTHIMPAGVGYDIACGNLAVKTGIDASSVDVEVVMDEIVRRVSFGVGRANNERVEDHPVFDMIALSSIAYQRSLIDLARNQLGTVGSGNHYVDLFEDRDDGRLWIGIHFGSRGFGHKTATYFLEQAGSKDDSMDATPVAIPLGTPLADDYYEAMQIAGEYAYAGRQWVADRVRAILGAEVEDEIHNHHNFFWSENIDGEEWVVTRKGATPAYPGQRGFIGGSMGDDAVIVEGVESEKSKAAFYSTVHGAGRVMGRMEARGKFKAGVCVREPKVNWKRASDEVAGKGIVLRGGGADEAPECYKRLPEVLEHHAGTIRILHRLRPIGVAMAGANEVDPYKD
jgi:tRNA-splicing ligase RtcB (3'-phosphate/5'-hydroxy nucleic acid ligase)